MTIRERESGSVLRHLLRVLIVVFVMYAGRSSVYGASKHTQIVNVGEASIRLVVEQFGERGSVYLNLHENEATSVRAARQLLQSRSGTLITLQSGKGRLVLFRHKGVDYRIDPNRIFSDVGIEKTLKKNSSFSKGARDQVRGLRDAILKLLDTRPNVLVVALHNNTPNGDYSFRVYLPGGFEAKNAEETFLNPRLSVDDFFLVTKPELFAKLRTANFNVVLQSDRPVDDGSLSVRCQVDGRSYVNVEALFDNGVEQLRMLRALAD